LNHRVNYQFLVELAEEIGIEPVYLEKDFVLTEIIRAYAQGIHRDVLVLKGGQALRHIYGSPRLSKDVDFVAKHRIEFDTLRDSLKIRYPKIDFPDAPTGRTSRGYLIRPISYRGPIGIRDSVEMEISFRGDLVLGPDNAVYESPFCEPFSVLVMKIEEMICEKMRALYQRGNPRDLYDLWFVFTHANIVVETEPIVNMIEHKFRPPFVAGGWDRSRLYDLISQHEGDWEHTLRAQTPDFPGFDDALSVVQKALHFLPK
jgi:predicted nucleotidyltransferase component of viral defense system